MKVSLKILILFAIIFIKELYDMKKDFSAKVCPSCESIEITTLEDMSNHKRVFICGNPICLVSHKCNTIIEETFKGIQYPSLILL